MRIAWLPVSACATHYIAGRFVVFLFTMAFKLVKHWCIPHVFWSQVTNAEYLKADAFCCCIHSRWQCSLQFTKRNSCRSSHPTSRQAAIGRVTTCARETPQEFFFQCAVTGVIVFALRLWLLQPLSLMSFLSARVVHTARGRCAALTRTPAWAWWHYRGRRMCMALLLGRAARM